MINNISNNLTDTTEYIFNNPLKFMINKSLEELNYTISLEDSYIISPYTSLNNVIFSNPNNSFARTNSLILIATKTK